MKKWLYVNRGAPLENYRIILARHGENEDNANKIFGGRRDKPLTAKGLQDAETLANTLLAREIEIVNVFSGKTRRSYDTAAVVAKRLNVSHTIIPSIMERCHGIMEGLPESTIKLYAKEWKEVHGSIYIVEVEGGEDYPTLCKRAKEVLVDIHEYAVGLDINGDILVVGHGALNRAMLVNHKGLTHENIHDFKSLGNGEFWILE